MGGNNPKMSNYCLYMLVIYYLQNTQPPVLPTVKELAELAGTVKHVLGTSFMAKQSG